MKRCPACETISPDSQTTCGVCGNSLADVPYETREEIQREQNADVQTEKVKERGEIRKVEKRRIAVTLSEFSVGIVAFILGFVLVGQYNSFYGIIGIFLGVGLVFHSIGIRWGTGRRYGGRWR